MITSAVVTDSSVTRTISAVMTALAKIWRQRKTGKDVL